MNIGVAHFKPYYDSFSPFLFQDGKTSGKLVFNFDNGNIGSTNELKFSELKLTMKEDYADKGLWYLSTEDLYVYLTSTADEIIFDFKIKGPIERPRFMPGSNTKRALALLALNKIMKVGNELQKQLQADMVPAGSEPDSENSAEPLPPAR
jgi:hypothetical protein